MSIAHVFVDEYGTPSLNINKDGVTPYFIYVGVVLEEQELQNARVVHKEIVNKYFQGTHIKSSNIPNNEKGYIKRVKILSELAKFQHYVVALVVDKKAIISDGLQHKRSFIKFFNNLLSKQFTDKYSEYHIVLDKTGSNSFCDSLHEYMDRHNLLQTLFSNNSFKIKDDIVEEPLVQVADFYAGCIGKYYCGQYQLGQAETINNILRSYSFIEWFPIEYVNYLGAQGYKSTDFSKDIADIAINTAKKYLQESKDEIGCAIIQLLLQEYYINPFRVISGGEIKKKINNQGLKINYPINEIAKLRSSGVLIVSPLGKKGYKFPRNEREIAEFYDRLSSNVIPQLQRGHILHQVLVEQSFNKHNILANGSYEKSVIYWK